MDNKSAADRVDRVTVKLVAGSIEGFHLHAVRMVIRGPPQVEFDVFPVKRDRMVEIKGYFLFLAALVKYGQYVPGVNGFRFPALKPGSDSTVCTMAFACARQRSVQYDMYPRNRTEQAVPGKGIGKSFPRAHRPYSMR